jgi:rare lipoprotein A (peptidoglycan hydrolase)
MKVLLPLLVTVFLPLHASTTDGFADNQFFLVMEALIGGYPTTDNLSDDQLALLFDTNSVASSSSRIDAVAAVEKSHCKPQAGLASWYGGSNDGGITASGERFNMYAMTAANRTLPLGTRVRVTNKHNGKSVIVRINDRGPYVNHGPRRVIDLSQAAAVKLDILDHGLGLVEVDCL